ncbi:lantibiotic dehydratase [Pedobacter riviphilus]|uniref:Lantibiotic dehydratase n=1 Tax=Pedobacter riviphilus TaxID=2766984 RepID=A0ABX6TLV6_9SPHI|nr:lantibiotic dehydratase [Pedobacter riviphilus]QNR86542.1 lantibiotic dehydratase [Pedobacter riviphilus]
MSLQIFPYSLVRYAGLHHQLFDNLKFNDTEKLLKSLGALINEKEQLKNCFCDALYPIITEQQDDKVRQLLINIKRQIFNDKKINNGHILHLPQTVINNLQSYLDKAEELAFFLEEKALKFEEEQDLNRKWLQQMALNPELQNGLLLSSPLLYEQLKNFVKKDSRSFKQKEQRILFSLLRYLSRMAFKTSPFSSFTYTGLMTLDQSGTSENPGAVAQVNSRLKLNNSIFEYLKAIIKKHPLLNEHLFVKLNLTAEIKEDKICFLSNFNNIESFQQINANSLQLIVYQHLDGYHKPVTLKNLIDQCAIYLENPSHESIKIYLIKLVESGMLEMNPGFSGMDEHWDDKLLLFLKNLKREEPSVLAIIALFERLKDYRRVYQGTGLFERYNILQQAEKQLNAVFADLQQEAGLPLYSAASDGKLMAETPEITAFSMHQFVPYYFSARHIFYEDCFTSESLVLPGQPVEDFVSKTDELISYLLPLDVMRNEREKMIGFFLKQYSNDEAVALTTFYKDYYLYVKKPEKEHKTEEGLDFSALRRWKEAIMAKIDQLDHANENLIRFNADFFADLPKSQNLAQKSSLGMFVQFSDNEDGFSGVINALLPGMGKVSGRFLSLFDPEVTLSFVQYNEKLFPDQMKLELNDASTFNANIHPPLLAHELELPGGNNIYPLAQRFNIRDLKVRYNKERKALSLHSADLELFSYDLSLESFYNRSNLYQLLAHFNPDARVSLQPFIQLVDRFYLDKYPVPAPDIFVLPRIVYAENVVIRRKTWRIKTEIIPLQGLAEADFTYFIRLNNWLDRNKIPKEIFIFLRKRAYQAKPEGKREGLHDDYKPQYLSFTHPLLVGMFKKLLLRAGEYITLEEVFPKPDQNTVREYLIQWYNN